jgi:hypothetical protein
MQQLMHRRRRARHRRVCIDVDRVELSARERGVDVPVFREIHKTDVRVAPLGEEAFLGRNVPGSLAEPRLNASAYFGPGSRPQRYNGKLDYRPHKGHSCERPSQMRFLGSSCIVPSSIVTAVARDTPLAHGEASCSSTSREMFEDEPGIGNHVERCTS